MESFLLDPVLEALVVGTCHGMGTALGWRGGIVCGLAAAIGPGRVKSLLVYEAATAGHQAAEKLLLNAGLHGSDEYV